ncbi:GGDEF domain-containing protein [Accumulibacter sp.]|uniref:GGDEF domain-containing protein n=1 Tax=Accumulibacter sp. TaxID=2053492 RepID=UPI0028C3AD6E|nr:diguanylate cyclase [Accumulibacter sp.]
MDNPGQQPRILIVDQSPSVRAALVERLRDEYRFREEVDGEGAWQALVLDNSIQLLICAPSLPVLDDDGLLARVRSSRLARLRQLPVLMIADDNEAINERARLLGTTDFIAKGIGTSEMLARIDSQLRLAQAHNELRENPERDTQHRDTGLATRERLGVQAARAISHATRHHSPVSILVMGFDNFDALREEHGDDLVKELQKRFATMLTSTVRTEDRLGHYSDSDLAVVSPGTPYPACEAFANRLREAFALAKIAVRGKRLQLLVSIGVANAPVDQPSSARSLLDLAAERLGNARKAGGNRVIACRQEPSSTLPALQLGQAISLIKAGHEDAVVPHLIHLGKEILPFLELLERELKLGLPLADIRKRTLDREQQCQDTRQA